MRQQATQADIQTPICHLCSKAAGGAFQQGQLHVGAFGKLLRGYLGARIGMMKTVWLTETSTALLIVAAVYLPLTGLMVMLPVSGLALNGTSSVLYGAIPDLAGAWKREQAFAVFYTGTIGGGALAPVVFGGVGDALGGPLALIVLAGLRLPGSVIGAPSRSSQQVNAK